MDQTDQSANPLSPFYLHQGENPGLTLITQVLNENNYSSWSISMRRALKSKNKIKFIDGSIKKPPRIGALFDSWERCNVMVLSWITKTLSPQIAESVIYVEDAKELWDELRERFSKGDYFKISDLLQDIHSIKQGERGGLNDTYNTVRTQILLMDPIPNINRVFSLIMQQERQEKQDSAEIKILANVADRNSQWRPDQTWRSQGRGTRSRGQGRGRGKNSSYGKQCSYCNKMNHTVDECYAKHGYPPWYKKGDNNQDKRTDWSSANACQNSTGPEGIQKTYQGNSSHRANNNNILNSFTPEQVQKLLKMIDKTEEPTHKINQVQ
ncbi:uncharacterized protein LOC106760249 [Vigna radiata var. radiata]|uniref:Uncharacterized protein LOC106760249 n=1 Tax=Vigna radiata var. radiata TaxID=3916 RepID=A0A1S3TZK7_VIGRR|nr:uncharacterized protein LOC106760249 [Vigna radiata var. radiata]